MPQSAFAIHVAQGLAATQAYLSSRFIYDERGSKLFQQIMQLDEYYLTRAEAEILGHNADAIVARFGTESTGKKIPFELIELGAGDGAKTKLLLKAAVKQDIALTYRPVDISKDILSELSEALASEIPNLQVDPIAASYDEALASFSGSQNIRRVVLFLGSNIGNFSLDQARAFCAKVCQALNPGDLFMIGVDLRKDPRQIRAAYDDGKGVTAEFNRNLLHRMRKELGAKINVDAWGFYALYNPETGEVRSYLYPTSQQRITIPSLNIDRTFNIGEVIHTEVSRKYLLSELDQLATDSDCDTAHTYLAEEKRFVDVLWVRK